MMRKIIQKLLLFEEPEEKSPSPILVGRDKAIVKSLAALMLHVVEQKERKEVDDEC